METMIVEEHAAKSLLAAAGIAVSMGRPCRTAAEARTAADAIGPCSIKAQIAPGRGGEGRVAETVSSSSAAEQAASRMLGSIIDGQTVDTVLVEAAPASIAKIFFAAISNHRESKSPLLLFSTEGGLDFTDITRRHPDKVAHLPVDIRDGVDDELLEHIFGVLGLEEEKACLVEFFLKLYDAYRISDAALIEVRSLALTTVGEPMALDCRLVLDDRGASRRPGIATHGRAAQPGELEQRARQIGLAYRQLDGEIGVLADGAGLAMASMDVIGHYHGRPAAMMIVPEDEWAKIGPALEIVFAQPGIKCLLVGLSGLALRADRMTDDLLAALDRLDPAIMVVLCLSVGGRGENDVVATVKNGRDVKLFGLMDQAAEAAVEAAR